MDPINLNEGSNRRQIEELEPKLALNRGETVLPLGHLHIPDGIHRGNPLSTPPKSRHRNRMEVNMPVFSDGSVDAKERGLFDCSDAPFVVRCQFGRIWKVTVEGGAAGQLECAPCSCGVELVASNGATGFNLSLVADPS